MDPANAGNEEVARASRLATCALPRRVASNVIQLCVACLADCAFAAHHVFSRQVPLWQTVRSLCGTRTRLPANDRCDPGCEEYAQEGALLASYFAPGATAPGGKQRDGYPLADCAFAAHHVFSRQVPLWQTVRSLCGTRTRLPANDRCDPGCEEYAQEGALLASYFAPGATAPGGKQRDGYPLADCAFAAHHVFSRQVPLWQTVRSFPSKLDHLRLIIPIYQQCPAWWLFKLALIG